jgi:hypothetical protein
MKYEEGLGSSAGIATRLRPGLPRNLGSISGKDKRFLSTPQHSDRLWGPSSLLSDGYRALSWGVKWPMREADQSPLSSVQAKNGGAIPMLPHMPSYHGA